MKKNKHLMICCAMTMFLGLLGYDASTCAQNAMQNSVPYGVRPSVRPPFDAGIFWAKLYGLIQLHGGYVEPDEVESSFGVKIAKKINIEDASYRFEMDGGSPWFENIDYRIYSKEYKLASQSINAGGVQSSLDVFWGYFPGEASMCIKPNSMRDSLINSGWKLASREATGGEFGNYNYYKLVSTNGSSIGITYGDGRFVRDQVSPEKSCVISVSISGRK